MALRHGSSAGIGMMELVDLIAAFEQQNSVVITITGRRVLHGGKTDWRWEAKAWETMHTFTGRMLLASASVRCLEKRLLTMEAVVLQLLYALDFQLGERELERTKEPKA